MLHHIAVVTCSIDDNVAHQLISTVFTRTMLLHGWVMSAYADSPAVLSMSMPMSILNLHGAISRSIFIALTCVDFQPKSGRMSETVRDRANVTTDH